MTGLLSRSLGQTIEIETVLPSDLWTAMIDPARFETALLNLALNARDAMAGGGKLTIASANAQLDQATADRHEDVTPGPYVPGPYVMVSVSDTGSGMAPEVMERAFEPFFTTKEVGQGSGLGLSMVYGFVKQSGGHVEIQSEVESGTTVKLYLPRARGDRVAIEPRGPAEPEHRGKGELVLVVEDDASVRALVVKTLASLGFRTVEAANGKSALAALDETPDVALLFTDVVLPDGMSGTELAGEARCRRPEIEVLFTSGYTKDESVHRSGVDHGVELLAKPYRKADLAQRLRAVLGRQGTDE